MTKQINGFTVPDSVYITLDRKQYIAVAAAAELIRQRFPTYQTANLYAAAHKIDSAGKVLLNTYRHELPGVAVRVLIPRADFEAWLNNPKIGQRSVPHRRNGKRR